MRLAAQSGITTFAAKPLAKPMEVVGNAPAPVVHGPQPVADQPSGVGKVAGDKLPAQDLESAGNSVDSIIRVSADAGPWVSAFMPPLPPLNSSETASVNVPRLVARMQSTTDQTRWPAPHQMWPAGWRWPEYRLEIDDLDWAVSELASALSSMRCPVEAVTVDGGWW